MTRPLRTSGDPGEEAKIMICGAAAVAAVAAAEVEIKVPAM